MLCARRYRGVSEGFAAFDTRIRATSHYTDTVHQDTFKLTMSSTAHRSRMRGRYYRGSPHAPADRTKLDPVAGMDCGSGPNRRISCNYRYTFRAPAALE